MKYLVQHYDNESNLILSETADCDASTEVLLESICQKHEELLYKLSNEVKETMPDKYPRAGVCRFRHEVSANEAKIYGTHGILLRVIAVTQVNDDEAVQCAGNRKSPEERILEWLREES